MSSQVNACSPSPSPQKIEFNLQLSQITFPIEIHFVWAPGVQDHPANEPDEAPHVSPSPKSQKPQARRSQASLVSFSGQSRYFELELSPIIEYPVGLAPSAVIRSESGGGCMLAHDLTGEAARRSSESFEDVFSTPNEVVRPDSEVIPVIHPRNLMTDLIAKSEECIDMNRQGASRQGEAALPSAIPAVVLTAPTPDPSIQSPVQDAIIQCDASPHGAPALGPKGLGLIVDNVPRDPGDEGGEDSFLDPSHAQPQAHIDTLASRARKMLFRRSVASVDRGRRGWDTLSRFLSNGRSAAHVPGMEDTSHSTFVAGCRRGLDLSFASTTSRWFGSPGRESSSRVRRMFR
ncbi:hypothetical protein DXG01_015589 [Tephrocybe rancida]|nr:hypothetical protein DXG01_015589 [Tephrocybe rancida]